jgi:hypothetical protein
MSSAAFRLGSTSSHALIRGQTPSNGSGRVRQWRVALGFARCVGLISPSCQAVVRLSRNFSRSAFRPGGGPTASPLAIAAK